MFLVFYLFFLVVLSCVQGWTMCETEPLNVHAFLVHCCVIVHNCCILIFVSGVVTMIMHLFQNLGPSVQYFPSPSVNFFQSFAKPQVVESSFFSFSFNDDDDELMLNVLRCHETY